MKKLVISALIAGISATAPLYAQTAAADSIEQQVFDKSFDVAVLSPQEMRETEGAFTFGTLGNGMLFSMSMSAVGNHALHYLKHGETASMDSTLLSLGTGAVTGYFGYYGPAAMNKTTLEAIGEVPNAFMFAHNQIVNGMIEYATYPHTNSNN